MKDVIINHLKKAKIKWLSIALVFVAGIMLSYMPVKAVTYTPKVGGRATFKKYFVVNKDTTLPEATFTYTIEAGEAVAASSGKLPVFSGFDTTKTTYSATHKPTIGNAVFAPSNTTVVGTASDHIADSTDKKYATEDVTVDFSDISYKEPGVYRYIITEVTTPAISGVSYDTKADNANKTQRTLDVYVEDDSTSTTNNLKITGYVMYEGVVTTAPASNDAAVSGTDITGSYPIEKKDVNGAEATDATKSNSYVNEYDSYKIELSKTVDGNQGSKDEYFKFTVAFTGGTPSAEYTVDLTNAHPTTATNGINTETHTNPAKITLNASGAASVDFYLQNGQSIVIKGVGASTKYTVTEDYQTASNEGYKISATATEKNTGDVSNTTVATDGKVTDSTTGIGGDTEINYTNTKKGTIPTGIIFKFGPFVAVSLLLMLMIIVMFVRLKQREYEE